MMLTASAQQETKKEYEINQTKTKTTNHYNTNVEETTSATQQNLFYKHIHFEKNTHTIEHEQPYCNRCLMPEMHDSKWTTMDGTNDLS